MPVTTKAFSHAQIDALLERTDWAATAPLQVSYQVTLSNGERDAYVLLDCKGRGLSALEAKHSSFSPAAGRVACLDHVKPCSHSAMLEAEHMAAAIAHAAFV